MDSTTGDSNRLMLAALLLFAAVIILPGIISGWWQSRNQPEAPQQFDYDYEEELDRRQKR